MKAKLKVIEGAKPVVIRLKLPTTIGRSEDASLTVPQSQVSRQHCEIYEEDGMLVVDDLGSSNGTFINDERIDEPTFLYPQERLRVGKLTFEAVYDAPDVLDEDVDPEGTEIIPAESANDSATHPVESTTGPQPAAGGGDHVLDEAAEVSYEESDNGSFLGIHEIDTGNPPPPATDSAKNIQVEDAPQQDVDPGDSALNSFFKNFE